MDDTTIRNKIKEWAMTLKNASPDDEKKILDQIDEQRLELQRLRDAIQARL